MSNNVYSNYINFLTYEKTNPNKYDNFKNDSKYREILEHVSLEDGKEYLNHILSDFIEIEEEKIINFTIINEMFGNSIKNCYNLPSGKTINCSPTTLRYIYHSLIILNHYKTTNCKNFVEIGCGYGGLFLAIVYFSKHLNCAIDKYYLIDLPEANDLIEYYLNLHKDFINIKYEIHNSENYGNTVPSGELFLISNYCYTEINDDYKKEYNNYLINRVNNGFIIWQSGAYDIKNINKINILPKAILQEKPSFNFPNYFVYF